MISLTPRKKATLSIGNTMLRNVKLMALDLEPPIAFITRLSKLGCRSFLNRNTFECANWSMLMTWSKLRVVAD
jgi:hypothetical protein